MKSLALIVLTLALTSLAAPVNDPGYVVRRHGHGGIENTKTGGITDVDNGSGNDDSHDGDNDKGSVDGVDNGNGDSGTIAISGRSIKNEKTGNIKNVDNNSGNHDDHDGDDDKGSVDGVDNGNGDSGTISVSSRRRSRRSRITNEKTGKITNVDNGSGNHDNYDGDNNKGSVDGVDNGNGDSGTISVNPRGWGGQIKNEKTGKITNVDNYSGNGDNDDGNDDKGSCDGVDNCNGDSGVITVS
jgi:hypothetical protein